MIDFREAEKRAEHRRWIEDAINTLAGCIIDSAELVDDGGIVIRVYNPEAGFYRHVSIKNAEDVDMSWLYYNANDEIDYLE